MSTATIERVAQVVCGSPFVEDRLTVVWHAGEPLVLPIEYYRAAFAIFAAASRPEATLTHSFQSNGTLLDEHWVRFIKESGARVGISIDGPRPLHDKYRRTRSDRGTYASTLAGITRLVNAGVDFHVITVLTAESLAAPDELFDFYVDHGIRRVGFNVEEVEGPHTASSLQAPGSREAYAAFIRRIAERVKASPPGTLSVREITRATGMITDPALACQRNELVEPLGIVSVDVDGNISTFSPELLGTRCSEYADFLFGNIHAHDLEDVLRHPALLRAQAAIAAGVRRCAESCAYFQFCRGGAPANKLFENGDFATTETLYCRLSKKTLFDVVLADTERSLGLTGSLS